MKEKKFELNRREAVGALTIGAALLATRGGSAMADEKDAAPSTGGGVAPGQHTPVKLPFDPKKLPGLSERLLVSHHENNYGGALKNLNKVEEHLAKVDKDTPAFVVAGLKQRELLFTNSVILHEHYFANLGGDGKPGDAIQKALGESFGGAARWEELFRAAGISLAGGSGWAILSWSFQTGDLRIFTAADHTQSLSFGAPLLVLDMYEHAYHLDYGAAAAKYIDAFMKNVSWEEVQRRYTRARNAHRALRAAG